MEKKQIEPFELSFQKNNLESSTNDKENETSGAADTDDVDNYLAVELNTSAIAT
jgi:hypothetical protein